MFHQAITDNVSTKWLQPDSANHGSTAMWKDSPSARKSPIAELNKPIPMRTSRNTRTSRKRPSSTVAKPTTTMLKTLSGDYSNPKKLWSFIKGKKCDSSCISPLRRDGVAHSYPQVKVIIFNDQFASVTEEDTSSLPSLGPSPFPDVPAFEIDTAGVKKLLQGLKPHKASGPDNLPTTFFEEAANELAPALGLIFTASLNQGYVPDDWKTAGVTPIFKKGDRSTPTN